MPDSPSRWKTGIVPGLMAGVVVSLLAIFGMQRYELSAVEAGVTVLLSGGVTFGVVWLLYAAGVVTPSDRSRRFDPVILVLVVLGLTLLVLTEC